MRAAVAAAFRDDGILLPVASFEAVLVPIRCA